jgi:hypothetical protein
MRYLLPLLALVLVAQAVSGQRELPGAIIMGNDLCPDAVKQAAQQPAAQRSGSSSSLSRIFTRSPSAPAAPAAPAPQCRSQFKLCGDVLAVLKRCRETFGCRAVSYDGRCGYLKSSDGPRRSRTGWSTWIV